MNLARSLSLLALSLLACQKTRTAPADGGAAPALRHPPPQVSTVALPEAPAETGDLARLRERGALRVIVAGSGEELLPRQGMPASLDRELAIELAGRLRLAAQFVVVRSHAELLSALEQGKGDLVAAQLTVTRARKGRVAFTRPLFTVSEIVVGKKGAPSLPRAPADLAGRELHVRASSSYAETLAALAAKVPGLRVVPAPEHLDAETLVYEVTTGARPLSVVDSHLLDAIETYNPNVARLFPIADGRRIAWAVRKDSPELKRIADSFLVEKALSSHTAKRQVGDFDELQKRGSVRVLTSNNAVSYFLHKGQQFGFDYELARAFAKEVGLRLEVVVPPSHDLLLPWLLEGRGDVVAAAMTATPERRAQAAFSKPYLFVRELLVHKAGSAKQGGIAELAGKTVHVRRSSSYHETLSALRREVPGLVIALAPEEVETEDLLRQVADGKIAYTVSDSHILQAERTYGTAVEEALALAGKEDKREIAFAVRKSNPVLKAKLDAFVTRFYRGVEFNMARARYFRNKHRVAIAKESQGAAQGNLSPFDPILKKHTAPFDLDWRLLAAQAYQESRWDPKARSWAGAEGLFQLMPMTARSLGIQDLTDPDQGARAGIEYLYRIFAQLDPRLELKHRLRFALAAFNVGLGHVQDAQRLAAELGLNPQKWFGHVEKAMLLLEKPLYAARARYGFCRGSEPVKYVSQIQNRYDNYIKLLNR